MAINFGSGVSRVLENFTYQFSNVIWQVGKPPLDSELNYMGQLSWDNLTNHIREQIPSGFFIDPTSADNDYVTKSTYSNQFLLGNANKPLIANVNGWLVPVCGTGMSDCFNKIRLNPPPTSDSRIDFVFLEVWQALVSPSPSSLNKPTQGTIYRYGNVEYGGSNLNDDLADPSVGFETTKRVQTQYRIRTYGFGQGGGSGVDLAVYTNGLNDPNVRAQGASSSIGAFTFENMGDELKDASLWRAGNGDPSNELGSVDGYSYAIPVCAIFRRNSSAFIAVANNGSPNHNGATDRNPSASELANPRLGAKELYPVALMSNLGVTSTGSVQVGRLVNGVLESNIEDTFLVDPNLFDLTDTRFLHIGDEIIEIDGVVASTNPPTINIVSRGRASTLASWHEGSTSTFSLYNTRPDNVYADEITSRDILDLRKGVSLSGWDYTQLLTHNLTKLLKNELTTTFKTSGSGGNSQGIYTTEVSVLDSDPNVDVLGANMLDGADGIRTVFSDTSHIQSGVTLLLDNDPNLNGGVISGQYDTNTVWDIGADFKPDGWWNNSDQANTPGYKNGTLINLYLGGEDGTDGARGSFRDGTKREVRFVAPWELDKERGLSHPFKLKFTSIESMSANHVEGSSFNGYMHPLRYLNYEYPFIVLGGLVEDTLRGQIPVANLSNILLGANTYFFQIDLGVDFHALRDAPVIGGRKTFYEALTKDESDLSGFSSELYLVLSGDTNFEGNNGVFRIIGAGNLAESSLTGSLTSVVVEPLSTNFDKTVGFDPTTGATLTFEIRSQYLNVGDGTGFNGGVGSVVIGLTDINDKISRTWFNDLRIGGDDVDPLVSVPINSKIELTTTLLYAQARAGIARRPSDVWAINVRNGSSSFVRNALSDLDSDFASNAPAPSAERSYKPQGVQTWNGLTSLGLETINAPSLGGEIIGYTEQSRDAEAFVDKGSKTLFFKPLQRKLMSLKALSFNDTLGAGNSLIGSLNYPNGNPKDPKGMFTALKTMGVDIPNVCMPKFGRQDIPVHQRSSDTDPILSGVHHLFSDNTDPANVVFNLIGGEPNTAGGGNLVQPILFITGEDTGLTYGEAGTTGGPAHPCIQARSFSSTTIRSTDIGVGMKGIELPPHYGVARLYGVYERSEYEAKIGDATPIGAFESDRVTLKTNGANGAVRNLLNVKADTQTLFIRQGGAEDYTGNADDHTYIIPSNVIDHTRALNYSTQSPNFEDYEYVVECVVFGFARGFINKNNLILARSVNGAGNAILDIDQINVGDKTQINNTLEFVSVSMSLFAPAPNGTQTYMGYNRLTYQGDPFFTSGVTTLQKRDFAIKYGRMSEETYTSLNTPLTQFNADGSSRVETPNLRALKVLASADFYTTLGTGKVGGDLYEGSFLDCAHNVGVAYEGSELGLNVFSQTRTLPTQPRYAIAIRFNYFADLKSYVLAGGNDLKLTIKVKGATLIEIPLIEDVLFDGSPNDDTLDEVFACLRLGLYGNALLISLAKNTEGIEFTCIGNVVRITSENPDVSVSFNNGRDQNGAILRPLSLINPLTFEPFSSPRSRVILYDNTSLQTIPQALTTSASLIEPNLTLNGGDGNSPLSLSGATEQLPLGALLFDSDFISEKPTQEGGSALTIEPAKTKSIFINTPLTGTGDEYSLFLGESGTILGMCDGAENQYSEQSTIFRTHRGGSAFLLSGKHAGGPISWSSGSFPSAISPILKGKIIAGKAFLVQNFAETAFSAGHVGATRSYGGELQLLILTYGVSGQGLEGGGINLDGVISPTGFGEGFASAERYRIEGTPVVKFSNSLVEGLLEVVPAPYLP